MTRRNIFIGGLLAAALAPEALAQWTFDDQLSGARYDPSAVAHEGQAFFVGGAGDGPAQGISSRVDIYDPSGSPQWLEHALSAPRLGVAAASVGPYALFAGGAQDQSGSFPVDTVDVYDSTIGAPDDPAAWSTTTLSAARNVGGVVTVGSKVIFAAGAFNGGSLPTDIVDIYNYALGPPSDPLAWSTTTLSLPRHRIMATAVGTKAIFAGGGKGPPPATVYDVVDIYDDATGTWSTTNLSVARWWGEAVTVGQKAIIAGGDPGGPATAAVDVYDDSTGTWSTASLSSARWWMASTTLGDKALFMGGIGCGSFTVCTLTIDIYDDSTGLWTTDVLPDFEGRYAHAATSLGNKALFGGGFVNANTSDQVLIIGPSIEDCQAANYCLTAPNSSGAPAAMGSTGFPYFQHNNFALTTSDAPASVFGLYYYGMQQTISGFGDGVRCVGGSVVRIQPPLMTNDQGFAMRPIDLTQVPFSSGTGQILPGDTWNFQFWFRDIGGPGGSGFNLSDGLEVTFCD